MAYPYPIRCEVKIKIGDEPWRDVPGAEFTVIDAGPRVREVFIHATARFGIRDGEEPGTVTHESSGVPQHNTFGR